MESLMRAPTATHWTSAASNPPKRCSWLAIPGTPMVRRAGLTAVWVNRGSRTYPSYFLAPDLEARSLVDLAALLR
jgi:hypothetical protein